MIIFLYLAAIVSSDLLITHYGPKLLPVTSFFLIPFDLVVRDVLHDKWRIQRTLRWKMPLLILSGSVISFLINKDAKNVAIGSFSAFMAAGIVAGVLYQIMKEKPPLVKMNSANFVGALTDSFVFQYVAFASVSISICLTQWTLKFIGGALWAWVFVKYFRGRK